MFGVARECEYICLVPIPSDPNYIRFIIIHAYNHDQLFCQCCPSLVVFDPFHSNIRSTVGIMRKKKDLKNLSVVYEV
jgi:hypothetical protein